MKHGALTRRLALVCTTGLLGAAVVSTTAVADTGAAPPAHVTGTLADGSSYVMDVPAQWNGTVLLYSHSLVPVTPPGAPNPAQNAPNQQTANRLLAQGYALIGSSYVSTGWVPDTAPGDQIATLDAFTRKFGRAEQTIAWGGSMGGLVTTRIAEHYSNRIDGSLAMCGLVMGGTSQWDSALDLSYALSHLLPGASGAQLAGYADASAATTAATSLTGAAKTAQTTAAGRARIALATAFYNVPGYNTAGQTRPATGDWNAAEANQYQDLGTLIPMTTQWRQDAESHAGGNMSWNTGVDYRTLLAHSVDLTEVKALYKAAGLSLDADLTVLDRGKRVTADRKAVAFVADTSSLSGDLTKPQLDVHTIGDGLATVQAENAYRTEVDRDGRARLLRQTYVNAPGHCNFTTGEMLAAVKTIDDRITTGRWSSTSAAAMNAAALAQDPTEPGLFTPYRPAVYPRPYFLSPRPARRG